MSYRKPQVGIEPTTAPDSALRLVGSTPVATLAAEGNGRVGGALAGKIGCGTGDRTATGQVRWVVFQRTKRGRFRLTQYLFAPDKRAAQAIAALWYAGCTGTLDLMSYVEYAAMLDDLSALQRSRAVPAEPGQRRPGMKRGLSFGACVWCGGITSARGGRAPKYCGLHRHRTFQRAYRMAQARQDQAPRRQAVGA